MIRNVFSSVGAQGQHRQRPKTPYSDDALMANLQRLEDTWRRLQSKRARNAVYLYLGAVSELIAVWQAEDLLVENTRRALVLRFEDFRLARNPIAAVIYCTSNPKKVDRRTRSKWSRVLRYAAEYKSPSVTLERFVMKRGGINKCAARYTQRLGRHSKRHAKRQCARTLADDIREEW